MFVSIPCHASKGLSGLLNIRAALDDLIAGVSRYPLWWRLASNDLNNRYGRSWLGPLWTTLSYAVFVLGIGSLYAILFGVDWHVYLPHLMIGMLVWGVLSNGLVEGCRTFIDSARYLKAFKVESSVFVYRLVARNALVFLYQSAVFLFAVPFLGLSPSLLWLSSLAGVVVVFLNIVWVSILFGVVSARYRDVLEITSSALRILFFLTPVIWLPSAVGQYRTVVDWNIFYHFIEIVRSPIVSNTFEVVSWSIVIAVTLAGFLFSGLVYSAFRTRIGLWV